MRGGRDDRFVHGADTGQSAKAVVAVTLLALVLVAIVPVALLAGMVMMLLGHVVGGLALFGGSILAATIASRSRA